MFAFLIKNHTVFLVHFALDEAARAIPALRNSLVQINSKLNPKPYDYLYRLRIAIDKMVRKVFLYFNRVCALSRNKR